ncbi:hypothetical protein B0T10DRAFT_560560 [Thelonectria olida]|uniref:C3H1-type domain-containing protein n=1 Tax=Thelonectria olida TaxID=1576542 RepID=A0A9P9ARK2_9HYPO|nr:hypothetical protein B0T10DRAFT_560560 [Thelonectria olida]
MALCKFFQQGYCRYGNNCRFEHSNAGGNNNSNRNQPANRFGALGGSGSSQTPAEKYNITSDVIERDLTNEIPQWILSAYAPGRDAPGQLFGGYPREQSFEEMRLHFYTGKAAGNEQQALNDAQQLYTNAQQQMQNATRNVSEAIQFIVSAENNRPNRIDICQQGTQGAPFGEFLVGKRPKSLVPEQPTQPNPFGSNNNATPSTTQSNAFGQPSALGQKPSPFGAPSFGQPPQQASGFSQAGAQGASAFGQPSQPSAFGQPSTLGAKPSPFGASSFGTPSQPAQGNAFGQPSQLGQKPNPFASSANTNINSSSPFAAAGNSANNSSSPFASAGANNNASANPFGAPSGQNQGGSPFASNANNSQNANGASPFGQPSQAPSPFAQASSPAASNPFASANQGPGTANANNPFAQAQQPQQPNGFASQQNQQQNQQQLNPFGQPNAAPAAPAASKPSGNPYPPGSSRVHPSIESYSSKGMDGRLTMFKGKPVTYKGDKPGIRQFDGTWCRIWFPDGPPGYTKDTELPMDQYDDKSKTQWAAFQQTGAFQDGLMPELPPPRECTMWNF